MTQNSDDPDMPAAPSAPLNAQVRFACASCGEEASVNQVLYRCPRCDGLIEIQHDLERLKKLSAQEWRARFDSRGPVRSGWDGSGVWAKREWVHPLLAEEHAVSVGEGFSALVDAPLIAKEIGVTKLWIKQCGVAHTGSFKDLGMATLVSEVARLRAAGKPIRAVVCASTGDTSAALAAYGAAANIPTVVLLPRGKITTAQLLQPLAHGSLVLSLDTDFDGCMRIVRELAKDEELYLANSMNPWRLEGQKTVSLEIIQQLGWQAPDWIALPGGNLGNTFAVASGLEMAEVLAGIPRHTRLLVGQVEAANPFYLSWKQNFKEQISLSAGDTAATAIRIGAPVSMPRAIRALKYCGGVVTQASEDALADAAALADRAGQFLCPQSAAALAGVRQAVSEGQIDPKSSVVLVSTAHGLKFGEFKVAYHEAMLPGVNSRRANTVVEAAASLDAVKSALDKNLGGQQ